MTDNTVRIDLDLTVYRLSAVKKAAYRLAAECTIALGSPDRDYLPVSFMFEPGVGEKVTAAAIRSFYQELLDQELREQVAQETAPLRALIIAQAFSKTNLIGTE
jgi:His-Xaa-Ser system protein HxsD